MKKNNSGALRKADDGTILIEFAIVLPVLMLLLIPIYDFYNYIMSEQRAIKTGWMVGDMIAMSVSQEEIDKNSFVPSSMRLTEQTLENILQTAHFTMAPADLSSGDFRIEVSSIQKLPSTMKTHWSALFDGNDVSVTPNEGSLALPSSFENEMDIGENVIVVETTFTVRPVFDLSIVSLNPLTESDIVKRHYFPVRLGVLDSIN